MRLTSSAPGRRSIVAADGQNRVGLHELAELGELLGPDDAAHDAVEVFEVPHRVLGVRAAGPRVLRVRKLDRRQHAADEHFACGASKLGELRARVRAERAQRGFVLRRADGSSDRSRALPSPSPAFPFRRNSGRLGRAAVAVAGESSSSPPNRPRWPLLRSASTAAPLCMARSIAAISWARFAPSESNAPALMSVSIVARLQACGSTRSQKSNRLVNGPSFCRAADDRLGRAAAAAFDRAQAEQDLGRRPRRNRRPTIHIRRHDLDVHPLAIFQMLDERILALEVAARNVARQQRGHELDRIVGLQIRRLIGDQRVGGAVRSC